MYGKNDPLRWRLIEIILSDVSWPDPAIVVHLIYKLIDRSSYVSFEP